MANFKWGISRFLNIKLWGISRKKYAYASRAKYILERLFWAFKGISRILEYPSRAGFG